MSKETLVFVLGTLVFFVPFVGFPNEWKDWFLMGAGILLIVSGYTLRRKAFFQSLEQENGERRADVFVESPIATSVKQDEEANSGA